MIRWAVKGKGSGIHGGEFMGIDELARVGLEETGRNDFHTIDQLADRLAEAHEVLQKLVDIAPEGPEERSLVDSAAEVLALPPDLEAMVERRLGR